MNPEKIAIIQLIIDKFSRKCFIYLEGVRKYEFEAELGKNWVGTREKEGIRRS